MIPRAWAGFVELFIDPEGRVYRPLNGGDTVSEGQAYALLISSQLGDRETFDRVLSWTERHLSREQRFGDRLLAWHWEAGGDVTDWNSASDADVDYALALVFAHRRWREEAYLRKARAVLEDILRLETQVIGDNRYLLPGNWRSEDGAQVISPSYFSPAHFRIFSRLTGDPRWMDLVTGTYHVISAVSGSFEGEAGVGLIPDWIAIEPDGRFTSASGFSSHVGWDAIRIPWRIGLDYLWFDEPRAGEHMERLLTFYTREWERQGGAFFMEYSYQGEPIERYESSAAYAMSLAAFASFRSPLLDHVLEKIAAAFHGDGRYFQDRRDYYQNALTLLGLILFEHDRPPEIATDTFNPNQHP